MAFRLRATFILFILLFPLGITLQLPAESNTLAAPSTDLPLAAVNGPQKTLAILVRFPDKTNSSTPRQISSALSGVNTYYSENSYGTVSFQHDMTPSPASSWYSMPNAMTYYGADTSSSDSQLVHDALQAVNAGVNLANYKFAMVVHAGNDEALPPHAISDIHSYTIPGYIFTPSPLTSFRMSVSVVSESDPMGVYSHESGHLLGLPDLYDTTGQIDPVNNFVGYWEIMALGEWNPNNANPLQPQPGTYPAQMSAWSKIQLGFVPNTQIATVQSGESKNITIENLEQSAGGIKVVKIPISYNSDGSLTYYLLEMRAKLGTYDQYLPFPSTYPGTGLLIYKVNESIPNGSGSLRLIDAHPGGDLNDAPFGPCNSPCISNNTFQDQTYYVKVIVTTTTPTNLKVTVDRTSSPVLLLQVNTPSPGVLVSIDGENMTSDSYKQLRLPVRFGPHTVFVQPRIPISIGSATVEVGLTNSFASWDDGNTADPRGVSVEKDTVLTAIYRITVESSFTTAAVALALLGVVTLAVFAHRRKSLSPRPTVLPSSQYSSLSEPQKSLVGTESLPRDSGLPRASIKDDQEPDGSEA